jgi:hypothetical protein
LKKKKKRPKREADTAHPTSRRKGGSRDDAKWARTKLLGTVTVQGIIVGRPKVLGSVEAVSNNLERLARLLGHVREVVEQSRLRLDGLL